MTNKTLNIAEIEKKIKDIDAKKLRINQLQEMIIHTSVSSFEIEEIEKEIKRLNTYLQSKKSDKVDDELLSIFEKCNINSKKLDSIRVEYVLDNFILKNEITMIAAKPSSGKSLTTLAIANMALDNGRAKQVFYFDLDNSLTTLKERKLGDLRIKHGKYLQYIHPAFATKTQIWQLINRLKSVDLNDSLVIFDSAKNFMVGGDRDKNKDVSKITEIFKQLRDQGATVIFLHHTNKPQKDLHELAYAGSSAWEEDSSNAFILTQNEHKKAFIFQPIKNRVGELKPLAFKYQDNHTLSNIDYLEASETEEIEEITLEIKDYIHKQNQKPSYSQIMVHLQKQFIPRNKANQALQNGKNRYWKEDKLTQNNRSVYSLMVDIPVEIIYQDDVQDESIPCKSHKSYFREFNEKEKEHTSTDKWQVPLEIVNRSTNKIEIPII